ncbi:MAG: class D sortase [Acidaminobacter sp.]|uniref:class D sortase n=1 Tax=Acidaminobacter sp. TaxID=1872102 RepID=UPI00137D75E7|nr:class D sortase [Acidaminobacter sp.]MZQ99085.1 class D sortase [Acidaminobacter sp.]
MAVKAQAFKKKNRIRALISVCLFAAGIGLVGFALAKLDKLPFSKAAAEEDLAANQDLFIEQQDTFVNLRNVLHIPEAPLFSTGPETSTEFQNLAEGDFIGTLLIPALEQSFPIIHGTSDEHLKEGVGHYTQSVMPGAKDNCVLSGHRDTVFTDLGDLIVGDLLIIEMADRLLTYQINGTRIVDKEDRTVIVPTDHAALTLTTCYPFVYIGNAPQRYVVTAALIPNE